MYVDDVFVMLSCLQPTPFNTNNMELQNDVDSGRSEDLHQLATRTLSNVECRRRYASQSKTSADNISLANICTEVLNRVCAANEGGLLTTVSANGNVNELIGLVSWPVKRCQNNAPNVYTRMANYRAWIAQNSRDL